MAKALTLDIASNTRDFQKGVDDVATALDEVADSLDDISREGDRAGDKLGQSFDDAGRDIARDGETAADKLERSFSEAQREISRSSQKAAGDIRDDFRRAGRDAESSLSGIKDEAGGTARETAASFDGSVDSIVGGIQEVAANAGAVYGPAGLIAGLVVAGGLGMVTAEITKQQEEAAELKSRLVEAYKAAAEEGKNYIDSEQINAAVRDILWDTEKMDRYRDEAAAIGVDVQTYVRAQAGDYDALQFSIDKAREADETRRDKAINSAKDINASMEDSFSVTGKVRSELETLGGQHVDNKNAAGEYADYLATRSEEERAQIKRTRAADQARWEAQAAAIRGLPDADVKVNVTAPDFAAMHRDWQGKLRALGPLKGPTITSKLLGVNVP